MKLCKRSTLGTLLVLGSAIGGCMAESGEPVPDTDTTGDTVGTESQAFNPTDGKDDPTDINMPKGHLMITKKALSLLAQRDLLPPKLQNPANQKLIAYGVNFADHPWLGRPENPTKEVPNRVSVALTNGSTRYSLQLAHSSQKYSKNVESFWLAPDPTLNLTATTDVTWMLGNDPEYKPNPNYALMYNQRVHVNVDINDAQEVLAFSRLGPLAAWLGFQDTNKDIVRRFAVDNLYHYSLSDIYDLAPAVLKKESSIVLSPVTKEYCATLLGKPWDELNDESKDACTKIANALNGQPLLSGVQFGVTKYGSMLYQLARKFFVGSAAAPSLSELQKVGKDVTNWSTGFAQGTGSFSKIAIKEFPHTYLGGNPHVCPPASKDAADLADPCKKGTATWPVWVPDQAPTTTTLDTMEQTNPGRKDRAALIYLGWALHMMEDAAVPVHAANRTGPEHDKQDNLADRPEYFNLTAGKEQWLMDTYMKDAADGFFGNAAHPKSRDQICQSLNLGDNQVVPGKLNWESARPVFVDTAKTAYGQRQPAVPALEEQAAGASYVQNAVLGAMKLLLCATPGPKVEYVSGDFNGDGKTDLVITTATGSYWYYSTGTGTWDSASYVRRDLTLGKVHFVPGDFNGDGKTDLIITTATGSYWYYSTGTGTWNSSAYVRPDLALGLVSYTPGDFDGDGKTDLVITTASGSYWYYSLGVGKWNETAYIRTDLPLGTVKYTPGDFNGDGKTDLVIAATTGSYWYYSRGVGDWDSWSYIRQDLPLGTVDYVPGDFNGDGKTDLVITTPTGSYWYYSLGTGRWDSASYIRQDLKLGQVSYVPGDFNGDGKADLVITAPSGSYWYYSLGTGRWDSASYIRQDLPLGQASYVPGDFNGDRKVDLVISTDTGSYWYYSLATGSWDSWSYVRPDLVR